MICAWQLCALPVALEARHVQLQTHAVGESFIVSMRIFNPITVLLLITILLHVQCTAMLPHPSTSPWKLAVRSYCANQCQFYSSRGDDGAVSLHLRAKSNNHQPQRTNICCEIPDTNRIPQRPCCVSGQSGVLTAQATFICQLDANTNLHVTSLLHNFDHNIICRSRLLLKEHSVLLRHHLQQNQKTQTQPPQSWLHYSWYCQSCSGAC